MLRIQLGPTAQPQRVDEGPTAPALAKALAEWLPEFAGRCVAVSEAEITKENIPSIFPLALVAPIDETSDHNIKVERQIEITESLLISLLYEPSRYPRADGGGSGLWAYYDLHSMRNRILFHAVDWIGPNGGRLAYKSGRVAVEPHAVAFEFMFDCCFYWCPSDPSAGPCLPDPPCSITASYGPANQLIYPVPPEPETSEDCNPCP